MAFRLKWGIMATGGIAKSFAQDLLMDPTKRGANDVQHVIAAIASSSSQSSAERFAKDIGAPEATRTYGSYKELVADADVEIIYIATPQSRHYKDVILCLNAGKHVLCEKPFTINSRQAEHLVALSQSKGLFLMEAAWTRFFPRTKEILSLLHKEKEIGTIKRVIADFSLQVRDPGSRLHNPDLGGGALLDLGFYSLLWAFMVLQKHPDNENAMPKVTASVVKTDRGVDEFTSMTLVYERLNAVAHLSTSISARTPKYSVVIQGDNGEIMISGPPPRPREYVIHAHNGERSITVDLVGNDLGWEADACARALRDGKRGCEESPLQDTLAMLRIMDDIRRQGDFVFPAPLEEVEV